MSTTYLTIHDLLRVTYYYEARAAEARSRSNPETSICAASNTCRHPAPADPYPSNAQFTELETDFTQMYARKKRDSGIAMM